MMKSLLVAGTAVLAAAQDCSVTRELGCYEDGKPWGHRILKHTITPHGGSMTRESCAALVAGEVGLAGMPDVVVGVEYGVECYYDTALSSAAVKKDDADCNYKCPGDGNETCRLAPLQKLRG